MINTKISLKKAKQVQVFTNDLYQTVYLPETYSSQNMLRNNENIATYCPVYFFFFFLCTI